MLQNMDSLMELKKNTRSDKLFLKEKIRRMMRSMLIQKTHLSLDITICLLGLIMSIRNFSDTNPSSTYHNQTMSLFSILLISQHPSIGEPEVQSMLSKIKDIVDHAGHFQQQVLLKVIMPQNKENSSPLLSNNQLIANQHNMDAKEEIVVLL